MASNKHLRRVIVRLLGSMASPKEVQQYLKRFSDLDGMRFAVVKVGGAIVENHLAGLASSLTFLQQVGLTPDGNLQHVAGIETVAVGLRHHRPGGRHGQQRTHQ